jgi:hypothetical protein
MLRILGSRIQLEMREEDEEKEEVVVVLATTLQAQ